MGKDEDGRGRSLLCSGRSPSLVAVGDRRKGKSQRQERPVRKQS